MEDRAVHAQLDRHVQMMANVCVSMIALDVSVEMHAKKTELLCLFAQLNHVELAKTVMNVLHISAHPFLTCRSP